MYNIVHIFYPSFPWLLLQTMLLKFWLPMLTTDLNVGVLLVPFTASSCRGGAGRVELGGWGWEGGAGRVGLEPPW